MRSERVLIGVLALLAIAGVVVVVGLFSRRASKHRGTGADDPAPVIAAASPADQRSFVAGAPRRRSEPAERSSSATSAPVHADIPAVYRTLKSTANLALESVKGLGVEAQANTAEPYMIGMIQAIRAIDPNILTELKDVYADEMCGKTDPTPAQIVTYAKAVTFEARLGSGRGIECALRRSPKEDVVMWSLLDAWNNSGREQLPALAGIGASAKDERTLRRLYPDQYRAERLAAAAAPAVTPGGAAEAAGSRATNTSR